MYLRAITSAVFAASLSVGLASPAPAQTPDGDPPAVEIVCDDFWGAAWGLCNAYCEAMDCDGFDPLASANACDRVAAQFHIESYGALLRCGSPSICPCDFTPDGFAEITMSRVDPTLTCDIGQFTGDVFGLSEGIRVVQDPGMVGEDSAGVEFDADFPATGGFLCYLNLNNTTKVAHTFGAGPILPADDPIFLACFDDLLETTACRDQ